MCDEFELYMFMEGEASHQQRKKAKRSCLRQQNNPFEMDDGEFVRRYRLTKDLVKNLCQELRTHSSVPSNSKSTDLSLETKVLVALSFYATGSYQRPTGDIAGHSISQPSVSVSINEITKLLNLPEILAKYIKFPSSAQERRLNISRFYNKFGMPGVLGIIDGTHIAIVRPSDNEERYYCRKQYHSLNVQLICNADAEIISVDASYGGATHDSFIWANHPIKHHLEELSRNGSIWLLGDSGYPLRRYMMTPITDAAPGTPDAYYTEVHVRTRNLIERTIGLLKARFRCLLVHRVLHYTPQVAASIVNACVVLHNMCVRANVSLPELSEAETMEVTTENNASYQQNEAASNNRELNEGLAVRRALVSRLWSSRNPAN